MFFYRTFRKLGFPHLTSFESLLTVQKRAEFFFPEYPFRHLVNLYFDFSVCFLQFNTLAAEILKRIKENNDNFTPFQVALILQGATVNKFNLKNNDIVLVNRALRHFEDHPTEFDLNQKCLIFQSVASLDLFFMNQRNLFPLGLLMINSELMEKLHELVENNIINILKAFVHLPLKFSLDLLTALHELLCTTLEKNSNTIQTTFLIKYLDYYAMIAKKRKWEIKRIDLFTKELVARMEYENILNQPQYLGKVLRIYYHFKSEEFINKVKEQLRTIIKTQENCFLNLEFLAHYNVDIEEFLDEVSKFFNFFLILVSFQSSCPFSHHMKPK